MSSDFFSGNSCFIFCDVLFQKDSNEQLTNLNQKKKKMKALVPVSNAYVVADDPRGLTCL